jgi:regulator of protease activity HflC (stomatin/prohibitin superfamily)
MDGLISIIAVVILFAAFAALVYLAFYRRLIIFEHEQGLAYRYGKFVGVWGPGLHWYSPRVTTVHKVDIRSRSVTIPAQELLSADNVSIKVSVAVNYKIADPYKAYHSSVNSEAALYLLLQLQLRDLVGAVPMDELLSKRKQLAEMLLGGSREKAAELGIELLQAGIKDVMFPGELKNIYAQVVNARNEGLAALERARGESAALRNLANAAKLLENNPALLQLRILQAVENKPGNTIVFSASPEAKDFLSLPHNGG